VILIAGFIVTGAALLVEVAYRPPFGCTLWSGVPWGSAFRCYCCVLSRRHSSRFSISSGRGKAISIMEP